MFYDVCAFFSPRGDVGSRIPPHQNHGDRRGHPGRRWRRGERGRVPFERPGVRQAGDGDARRRGTHRVGGAAHRPPTRAKRRPNAGGHARCDRGVERVPRRRGHRAARLRRSDREATSPRVRRGVSTLPRRLFPRARGRRAHRAHPARGGARRRPRGGDCGPWPHTVGRPVSLRPQRPGTRRHTLGEPPATARRGWDHRGAAHSDSRVRSAGDRLRWHRHCGRDPRLGSRRAAAAHRRDAPGDPLAPHRDIRWELRGPP